MQTVQGQCRVCVNKQTRHIFHPPLSSIKRRNQQRPKKVGKLLLMIV